MYNIISYTYNVYYTNAHYVYGVIRLTFFAWTVGTRPIVTVDF